VPTRCPPAARANPNAASPQRGGPNQPSMARRILLTLHHSDFYRSIIESPTWGDAQGLGPLRTGASWFSTAVIIRNTKTEAPHRNLPSHPPSKATADFRVGANSLRPDPKEPISASPLIVSKARRCLSHRLRRRRHPIPAQATVAVSTAGGTNNVTIFGLGGNPRSRPRRPRTPSLPSMQYLPMTKDLLVAACLWLAHLIIHSDYGDRAPPPIVVPNLPAKGRYLHSLFPS